MAKVVIVSQAVTYDAPDLYMIRIDPKQGAMWGATCLTSGYAQRFTPEEAAAMIETISKTHTKNRRLVTESVMF